MNQRSRLLLLLLGATLPLVLLALVFLREGYEETRARVEQEHLGLANAGALATQTFLRDNIRTLNALAVELAGADGQPAAETRERLAALTAATPHWNGMSIVGTDGRVIVGGLEASTGQDLSGRPYMQQFLGEPAPVVSGGVVTTVTLVPSVVIAVPLRLADGTTGALLGAITLADLADELGVRAAQRPESVLSLFDHSGQHLIHQAAGGAAPLEPAVDRPEVTAGLEGNAGTTEDDGRLTAYSPVDEFGWAVLVERPAAAAFAPARTLVWQGLVIVGVSFAIILAIGWVLGGRVMRSYQAMTTARRDAEEARDRAVVAESHRTELLAAEHAARERAEEALRARDEFLSIASHELRNPVTTIKGMGQLMQRRMGRGVLPEDALREYVESIAASSEYLARMVEDLLSVSRLQGGRFDLRLERVDLAEVVRRAITDSPVADHRIDVERPDHPVHVQADVDRITQILVNLLENATKYSPAASRISVNIDETRDLATVAVTDEGIGLPEGAAGELFGPFARASNAAASNVPGLGLGLYISRRLAEAHGGSLGVVSPGEGLGSTFTLTLPRGGPALDPSSTNGASAHAASEDDRAGDAARPHEATGGRAP